MIDSMPGLRHLPPAPRALAFGDPWGRRAARSWRRARGRQGATPGSEMAPGRIAASAAVRGFRGWSYALGIVLVVGLVLLGRVAFAAHLLLVPHDICQHGKLVHLDGHRHLSVEASPSSERSVAVHGSAPSRGSHEHCDMPGIHEAPHSATPPAVPEGWITWQLALPSPPPATDVSTVPLLLLAPKQSPPRA